MSLPVAVLAYFADLSGTIFQSALSSSRQIRSLARTSSDCNISVRRYASRHRMVLSMKLLVISLFLSLVLVDRAETAPIQNAPLSRLVDCIAFAGSLGSFYQYYRETSGDDSRENQKQRAKSLRDTWSKVFVSRAEREIQRRRDADAIVAHKDWIYQSAARLPDLTGLANAVVIFENRVTDCVDDFS
jgi:hypothetical protein